MYSQQSRIVSFKTAVVVLSWLNFVVFLKIFKTFLVVLIESWLKILNFPAKEEANIKNILKIIYNLKLLLNNLFFMSFIKHYIRLRYNYYRSVELSAEKSWEQLLLNHYKLIILRLIFLLLEHPRLIIIATLGPKPQSGFHVIHSLQGTSSYISVHHFEIVNIMNRYFV